LTYYSGYGVSGSGTSIAPIQAGIYTVVASFAGSTDYASASSQSTFAITQATPLVEVSDSGGTFNGSAFGATASVSGVVSGVDNSFAASLESVSPTLTYYSGSSVSGSGTSIAPTQAGTYTVVASFAGSTDYSSASSQSTFAITKATPLASVSDSGGTFNGSAFGATASVSGVVSGVDNTFAASLESVSPTLTYYSGSGVSGSGTSIAPTHAGTYTVVASFAGSTDYASASSQSTFAITQATPLVEVSDSGGTFNGSAFAATASVSGVVSGVDNSFAASLETVAPTLTYFSGSSASGSGTSIAPTQAGTYTVVASFAGSTDYASASSQSTFIITKATPVVSVSDGGTFNGFGISATASVSGVVVGVDNSFAASLESASPTLTYYSGSSVSGSGTSIAPTQAGTYTVVASFPGCTDYASASSQSTFAITKATPQVSVSDSGGTFTGSSFPATASVSGVAVGIDNTFAASLESVSPTLTYYSGSAVSGSGTSIAPSALGTYTVVASFPGSTDYASASSQTTFAIVTNTPVVTVTDAGGLVNGSPFPASASIAAGSGSPSSMLEGVGLSLTYYAGTSASGTPLSGAPSSVGAYTVVASFPGSTDYASSSSQTTFYIVNTKLVIFQETQVTAGSPFLLTVTAETAAGVVDTSFSGSITLTLVNNPNAASFTGTLTETASSGQATFSNLVLDEVGVSYQIKALTTLGIGATVTAISSPFAVSPAGSVVHTATLTAPAAATDAGSNSLTYSGTVGGYTSLFGLQLEFGLESVVQPANFAQLDNSANFSTLFSLNKHGAKELNLVSVTGANLTNSGAYFIVPNGNLYAWNGVSITSSEAAGAVASLGSAVYADPELLYDASNIPYMPLASTVEGQLDLQQPTGTSTYFFNARGINEKYLQSSNGSNSGAAEGFYIIVPNGNLYAWTNSLSATLLTTPVATLPAVYYENPVLLTLPTPQGNLATVTASVTDGTLSVSDTGFQGEVIAYVSTADGTQTYLATFTDNAPVVTQPPSTSSVSNSSAFVTTLNSTDVAGDSVTYANAAVGGDNPLFDVEQQLDLAAPPQATNYFYNTRGYKEKYLISNNGSNLEEGSYYMLLPNGNLYAWDNNSVPTTLNSGFFVTNVGTAAYKNPTLLTNAQPGYDPAAFSTQQTLDLASGGANYFYNNRGEQEKYLVSQKTGTYYIMMPNGNLYAFIDNSIIDTLDAAPVAALPSYYYQNPTFLFNAAAQGTPTGVTVNLTGDTLTVNPNGYVGTVTVYFTVSDGILTTNEAVLVTFTAGPN
jgi:hypothetical protein